MNDWSTRFAFVAAFVAAGMLAAAPAFAGDTTSKVKDGWGRMVEVKGYDDAKLPGSEWYVHDSSRPQPKAVEPGPSPTLGMKAPDGAVVLYNNAEDAAKWTGGKWEYKDGYMEIRKGGSLATKQPFGSMHLHIEWAAPEEVKGDGQGRGNSGVILMGKYEVQVLDCWKNATYPDGMTASVYGQYPPLVNACRPPGEWQTYDIIFEAPQFEDDKLVKPGYVTVAHNGILVQNRVKLYGQVSHRRSTRYYPHADKLPLVLQDHGNPVRFRNIWAVPID